MPMNKEVIGIDSEGKPVNVVWGADLNWAHGFVENNKHEKREYYRAQGKGNAHYLVWREISDKLDQFGKREFKYWYATMHIDGQTNNLMTEFMSAYEGQEVCQIFESERTRAISKEPARIGENKKLGGNNVGR